MVVSFNPPILSPRRSAKGGFRAPAPFRPLRRPRFVCSNAPDDAALLTYFCPRYQHLDIYLPTPVAKPSTSLAPVAATASSTASPSAAVSDPSVPGKQPVGPPAAGLQAAGTVLEETALESKQQQLPAIDFSGEREPPRQAAPGGDRGGGRGGVKPSPKPSEQEAVSPAREPIGGGGGGEDTREEGGESGEETTSVNEEDFLALPIESAEGERGEGGSGPTEGEVRFVPGRRPVGVERGGFPRRQEKKTV